MKKIMILLTLLLMLCIPASFAVEHDVDETGGYIPFLFVNDNYYDFSDDDFIYDYDGIYLSPKVFKNAFNLDIVRTGDAWVVTKDQKELGKFTHSEMFKMSDELEVERAWTTEDKKDYLLLEGILDLLGPDFTYSWELIADPETDSFETKLIHTFVPQGFCNLEKLEAVNPVLNVASIDKLKAANAYIKKMSKNIPKVNKSNNTITYTDSSCSVIISLNMDTDITISHTGKLTQTAYDLIGLAYNDVLDKSASKLAVAEIKRINGLMTNKAKAADIKKIEKRDSVTWYYFGDDGLYKWSYEFNTVQGKKYLDFCVTDFFMNTISYYE